MGATGARGAEGCRGPWPARGGCQPRWPMGVLTRCGPRDAHLAAGLCLAVSSPAAAAGSGRRVSGTGGPWPVNASSAPPACAVHGRPMPPGHRAGCAGGRAAIRPRPRRCMGPKISSWALRLAPRDMSARAAISQQTPGWAAARAAAPGQRCAKSTQLPQWSSQERAMLACGRARPFWRVGRCLPHLRPAWAACRTAPLPNLHQDVYS